MSVAQPPRVGDVIPFWYLWWREHERGEESGRKLQPCLVIVALRQGGETRLAVLPITHSHPGDGRDGVEIPQRVKAHLGMDAGRSWIICDEQNEFTWPGFDLGRTPSGSAAFGGVPDALLVKTRDVYVAARKRGALRSALRD